MLCPRSCQRQHGNRQAEGHVGLDLCGRPLDSQQPAAQDNSEVARVVREENDRLFAELHKARDRLDVRCAREKRRDRRARKKYMCLKAAAGGMAGKGAGGGRDKRKRNDGDGQQASHGTAKKSRLEREIEDMPAYKGAAQQQQQQLNLWKEGAPYAFRRRGREGRHH
ncbi:unnamed protein product [Vitrella brassicaformis CCMP3155]|uniref:Uncharacterized protein n=1 Tax=Vitrella brassicaformis (strain CCMP3155) TaxID=1169540 RepID=A0A0G4FJV5_VITBC|nr:unnamed protein product [Vitrella brassicaformis CCMP3155]|eukprot:CEM14047.1 unnamed protein product [Vitrella brassicaformis CCMP3155]